MDKYLKAEKRLHDLKGLEVFRLKVDGVEHGGWLTRTYDSAPRYCSDWSACGPLMVEHCLEPMQTDVGVCVCSRKNDAYGETPYVAHPDKDTAVRYAIVMAVIAKLEG